jgi:hypothetical protein
MLATVELELEAKLSEDNKFQVSEMTPELIARADEYTRDYAGTFSFMLSVQRSRSRYGNITPGQAKGALNCLLAEKRRERSERRHAAARQIATNLPDVPEGRYAVELDGVLKFYKVDKPTEGRWAGRTFVKVQASDTEYPVRAAESRRKVLETIAVDPRGALQRYGRELGHCGVCGRTLTDQESRAIGIGPICRENFF